jgi:hypothetical protein
MVCAVCAVWVAWSQSSWGDTWSQRLGYAADQRVVMISVHEMGLSWEMNEAGKTLLTTGDVQSASALATGLVWGLRRVQP